MRWLLAVVGWLAPNVLLYLLLASIPPSEHQHPVGTWLDWGAGYAVFIAFFSIFFAAGMISIRLALHAVPEWARPGLARLGFWLSLAFLLMCLTIVLQEGKTDTAMGVACLMLWGAGHVLGSRWKVRPGDAFR